ncbi:haloacid dehalogenase type II [Dasania marina]|uniref:haloacid dehalogenase type II n=1 Tax=Dasania marina TaxID=471499 RepID=UPI0030DC945F|tara:strand:+ start:66205 stop:66873 length:669 start_codon:yes stop_codon:yes gene_type:complete
MSITLAFDVYGTLIDTQGVLSALETVVAGDAKAFSNTWREKQLEYTFRRGLMQHYVDFATCTRQALDYTCAFYGEELSTQQKKLLLNSYQTLPAFDDVQEGLARLKKKNATLYAFSNGSKQAVEQLLDNAGIGHFFAGVVSCNEIQSFKPNPAVYSYFLRQANSYNNATWLISSNPFDVIGAISSGWRAAWLQRSTAAVFDPWDIPPTATVSSLIDLCEALD